MSPRLITAARTALLSIGVAALTFGGCATEGREAPLLRSTSGLDPNVELVSTFCSTRSERAEDWTCETGQDARFLFFQTGASGLADLFRWARNAPGFLRAVLETESGRFLVAKLPSKDMDKYVHTDGDYVWGYLPMPAFCGISDGEVFKPWALFLEFLPDFAGQRVTLFHLGAVSLEVNPTTGTLEPDYSPKQVTWRGRRSTCAVPTFSRPLCSGSECSSGQEADTIYFGTEAESVQNQLLELKQRIDDVNRQNPENPFVYPWDVNVYAVDANLVLYRGRALFENERVAVDRGPPRRVYAWVPTADLIWYGNDGSGGLIEVPKPRGGILQTVWLFGYDPATGEGESFEFVSDRPETSYRWH